MLKNVLSLLLSKFYSKKENETISHLATPNIANTVNVMLTTTESSAIVAPFDGYLNIETTAEGNPTINIWEALWCNATPISPFQAKIFVPVTKGQRIQYRVTGTISQARFVRLVGGGYKALKNALLQGGVLCLNSLSSSLRRSSCRVRRNGSGVKQSSQTQTQVPLSKWRTLLPRFTCHRPMDGLRLEETTSHLMLASQARWECVVSIRKDISELQRLSAKVMPLAFIVRRKTSNRWRPNSFPAKGQRNTSLVGGASC